MNIKYFFIKMLSYIKPINLGYSVTDQPISDESFKKYLLKPTFYSLSDDTGTWELLGIDKVKSELLYLVRHIESNKSIEIPKWWFDLMFKETIDEVLDVKELLHNFANDN